MATFTQCSTHITSIVNERGSQAFWRAHTVNVNNIEEGRLNWTLSMILIIIYMPLF